MAVARDDEIRRVWGARIRKTRGGRTQAEVAARVGIDQSTLSRIETGDYPALTMSLIVRIAEALGVEPRDLFAWPADRPRSTRTSR